MSEKREPDTRNPAGIRKNFGKMWGTTNAPCGSELACGFPQKKPGCVKLRLVASSCAFYHHPLLFELQVYLVKHVYLSVCSLKIN